MNKQVQDLRKLKTLRAIDQAFTKLINEKSFESLTIKDIAAESLINRGTFYMHYQDKYDLLTSYENNLLEGFSEVLTRNIENEETEKLYIGMPRKIAVDTFQFIDDNADKVIALFNNQGGNQFEHKVRMHMLNYYRNHSDQLVDKSRLRIDMDFLLAYITNAHIGLIRNWLENGRRETSEEVAGILETITVRGPFYAAGLID